MDDLPARKIGHRRWRTEAIDPEKFRDARHGCRLTIEGCANALGVTPRTVKNWEKGRAPVPYSAFRLLRLISGQELVGKAWKGWWLKGDFLISPAGESFDRKGLEYLWLVFRLAESYKTLKGLRQPNENGSQILKE